MKQNHTLSILVGNQPGAATKISGMFYRRGYNIETMTVYKTHILGLTKMIISGQASDRDAEHLRRQIENMVEVSEARLLDRSLTLSREMCLVQMEFDSDIEREAITRAASPYPFKIRAINGGSIILEVVAAPDIVDDFVSTMARYNMADISRTGMTVIGPNLPTVHDEF